MDNLDFNLQMNTQSKITSLKILINQCWKTLPIYEGKNRENQVVYSRDKSYENYQKHLTFLITKTLGASKIWYDNQYYVELVYMLSGMRDFTMDDHDRVKYIVHHCTKLINNMIDEVQQNES